MTLTGAKQNGVGVYQHQSSFFHLLNSLKSVFLKGQLHEIFDPRFFHQSTPARGLIHGLKPFCIWPNFRQKKFDNIWISAGSMNPLKPVWRGHWHLWNDTISAGSFTPLKLFWRLSKRLSRRIRSHLRNEFTNQGPRWGWLMKKTEVRKSRATIPLSRIIFPAGAGVGAASKCNNIWS
jgi:hypothetical protein